MKRLLISNFFYPFPGGEQFLKAEVESWEKCSGIDEVILAPEIFDSNESEIDSIKGLKVQCVPFASGPLAKLSNLVGALFSILFWKEVLNIFRYELKTKKLALLKEALLSCSNVIKHKKRLEALITKTGEIDGIYCYWSEFAFYAASLLKREGKVKKVFVRAHGYDLYKERRPYNYMPLKRQFSEDADIAFFLSSKAQQYYLLNYGGDKATTDIARLGVNTPHLEQEFINIENTLQLLSLSYCVPVKRLDKILSAVILYAKCSPEVKVIWKHIGSGDGFLNLQNKVQDKTLGISNLTVELKGALDNTEVHNTLKLEQFDAIVNASESEGVPVSLMEAMSYGIPAIAPNVGGISELVNQSNGFLLSEYCLEEELVNAFIALNSDKNPSKRRLAARNWVKTNFDAKTNHIEFISKLSRSLNEQK
ncbi:glycosyltransferase [Pseudoalteromonas sp. SS15]|uniref:glycosyltransferase n=1 Tax=Pseudoalteromonas sp. SS15 TaxID=3139393 RepID=UPI003BABE8EA